MGVKIKQLKLLLLGIIIFLILFGGIYYSVYAYTEKELDEIQRRNNEIIEKIKVIIIDIENQKQVIQDKEESYELKKEIYENIDQYGSWENAQKKRKAKIEMENTAIEFVAAKEQLISLMETQEKYIVRAANYQRILGEANIELQSVIPQNQTTIQNQTKTVLIEPIIMPEKQTIENQTLPLLNQTKIIISQELTGLRNQIGVELSNSCLTAIKYNLKTKCPSYEDLYYLDSSNQIISGKFVTTDDFFYRNTTVVRNSWAWYSADQTQRIFIDPPAEMHNKIKMITLLPNFKTYYQQSDIMRKYTGNDTSSMQEFDRVLYHDRYVNINCSIATINADKWKILLNDTINFMQNNCDESATDIDIVEVISVKKTEFDLTKSQAYIDAKRLKWIIKNCLFTYGACKELN